MRVHISLGVKNLEESGKFYRALFGQPATKVRDDYQNFVLDEPPIFLSLLEEKRPLAAERDKRVQEFGIELPDLEVFGAWRDRLKKDVPSLNEQTDAECCYATGEKLWLMDPDDNPWEIWVHTGEANHLDDTNEEAIRYRTPGASERRAS